MRYGISALAVCAALMLMGASGFMNFLFWLGQGQTERESHILGSVSVAFDIFKSVLPFCIAWAWGLRKRAYVVVGSVLFTLFFCFSLMSALGFAAGNRGFVTGGREALSMRLEAAMGELEAARAQLKTLPPHRVALVIEEEIRGMQKDRFWSGSQECSDPSGKEARDFCKRLSDRRTELAAAVASDRLSLRVQQLSREAEGLKERGAGQDKDPQAVMLSVLSGLDVENAKKAIIVFVAVLVELGAAFGLFLATGHSFTHIPLAMPAKASSNTAGENAAPLPPQASRAVLTKPREPVQPLRLQLSKDGGLIIDQRAGKT